MKVEGYDYGEFLRRVQAQQLHVRGRTTPTGCWVCDVLLPHELHAPHRWGPLEVERRMCAERSMMGQPDAHHVVPKRVIKHEKPIGALEIRLPERYGGGLAAACPPRPLVHLLMDPRNGILVRRLHHDQLESRHLAIPVVLLPEDTLEFAAEYELRWWLDNQESRRT